MCAFHSNTVYSVFSRFHLNCTYIADFATAVVGAIADKTTLYDDTMRLSRDHKITALIRDTTTNQRGVCRIENSDIGVCHRLALLVDDVACQVTVGLVGTFHKDLLFVWVACVNGHADGIEAYHLQDGIGQSFAVDGSGDAEVLQFIVEEHDGVVCLLLCKPAEGIGERHIIIFA